MKYRFPKSEMKSNRTLLLEQMEEQSHFCDVKIKVGTWDKKFHRCVLVASPVLDLMIKNNVTKQRQEETVDIKIGRFDTVEMAILYLYGKKPKLNMDNVASVLELAEFFLLPNLKSFCYSWLKMASFTVDNCLSVLMYTSIYGFEAEKCTHFIEGHLPEIFRNDLCVNLTKDSVEYLFSERKFSYVSVDEKMHFLLKWLLFYPDRKKYAKELCEKLDLAKITYPVLEQIRHEQCLNRIVPLEKVTGSQEHDAMKHQVLVTKVSQSSLCGTYWCLDLETERWYRLESKAYINQNYRYNDAVGVRNNAEIYFCKEHTTDSVVSLDIETDTLKEYKIAVNGNAYSVKSNVVLTDNMCYCTLSKRDRFSRFTRSILCAGFIENDNNTIMVSSLFTLRNATILAMCINSVSIIALRLFSEQYMFLYDVKQCIMTKVSLVNEYDQIAPTEDGFFLFNNNTLTFALLSVELPRSNTLDCRISEYEFENEIECVCKYYFFDGKLFRYVRSDLDGIFKFEFAPLRELTAIPNWNANWRSLPVTDDIEGGRMYMVMLPEHKLRCDLACPHCDFAWSSTQERTGDTDEEDYYYLDLSDDVGYERPSIVKSGPTIFTCTEPDSDDTLSDHESQLLASSIHEDGSKGVSDGFK